MPQDSNSADSVTDDDVVSGEQGASAGLSVVAWRPELGLEAWRLVFEPEHENRRLVHDRPEAPPSSVVVDIAMDAIAGYGSVKCFFFFFLLMPALAVGGFGPEKRVIMNRRLMGVRLRFLLKRILDFLSPRGVLECSEN